MKRTESLTADVGTVFHHLELNFLLAAPRAFTLLFQGRDATRLLLCPPPRIKPQPTRILTYGYCQENGYDGETARQNCLEISPHLLEPSREEFLAGGWGRWGWGG